MSQFSGRNPDGDQRTCPLIFVWTGSAVPRYAKRSLGLARTRYSDRVVLLSPIRPNWWDGEWHDSNDFGRKRYSSFRKTFRLDPLFRDGLWWHSYQRFFILEDFVQREEIQSFFHAELDTLLFQIDDFREHLDNFGSGIFLPMAEPRAVVVSLLYCNSRSEFSKMCSFLEIDHGNQNEMDSLFRYMKSRPRNTFSFATEQVGDKKHWPYVNGTLPRDTGIVDAASLGMWFFGRGPKTSRCTIWTRFRRHSALDWRIDKVRLLPRSNFQITITFEGGEKTILRSLHVSSKVIPRIGFSWLFWATVSLTQLGISVPVRPRAHCVLEKAARFFVSLLEKWSHKTRGPLFQTGLRVGAQLVIRYSNLWGIQLPEAHRLKLLQLSRSKTWSEPNSPEEEYVAANNRFVSAWNAQIRSRNQIGRKLLELPTDNLQNRSLSSTDSSDLISKSIQKLGFSGRTSALIFDYDLELLPVLLAHVLEEDNFVFYQREKSVLVHSAPRNLKYPRAMLKVKKDFYSLEAAKYSAGLKGFVPSWNFSTEIQIYESALLIDLFPDAKSISDWVKQNQVGEHRVSLGDIYGTNLLAKYQRKVRFELAPSSPDRTPERR